MVRQPSPCLFLVSDDGCGDILRVDLCQAGREHRTARPGTLDQTQVICIKNHHPVSLLSAFFSSSVETTPAIPARGASLHRRRDRLRKSQRSSATRVVVTPCAASRSAFRRPTSSSNAATRDSNEGFVVRARPRFLSRLVDDRPAVGGKCRAAGFVRGHNRRSPVRRTSSSGHHRRSVSFILLALGEYGHSDRGPCQVTSSALTAPIIVSARDCSWQVHSQKAGLPLASDSQANVGSRFLISSCFRTFVFS